MKTFKQHLEEATKFTPAQVQYDDYEMLPNAETAMEALNAYVGSIGEQEVLNPTLAVKTQKTNMSILKNIFCINSWLKYIYNITVTGGNLTGWCNFIGTFCA